jgi:hypothetical protein
MSAIENRIIHTLAISVFFMPICPLMSVASMGHKFSRPLSLILDLKLQMVEKNTRYTVQQNY